MFSHHKQGSGTARDGKTQGVSNVGRANTKCILRASLSVFRMIRVILVTDVDYN